MNGEGGEKGWVEVREYRRCVSVLERRLGDCLRVPGFTHARQDD